jgi:outer membrane protein assembly factor BamB
LLRLDASSGERIWAQPLPSFVKDRPRKRSEIHANHGPILAGERIYVASSDGLLRAFDPEDGALLNEISIPGGASTAPVVANETLFVVTTKGQLIALR